MGQTLSSCFTPEVAADKPVAAGKSGKQQQQQQQQQRLDNLVAAEPASSSSSRTNSTSSSSTERQQQQQQQQLPDAAAPRCCSTAKHTTATAAAAVAAARATAPSPLAAAAATCSSSSSSSAATKQQQQPAACGSNAAASAAAASASAAPCPCIPIQQQQQQQQGSAGSSSSTAAAAAASDGVGGVPLPPAGCAPAPGLPHNPIHSGPPLPPCDEDRLQDEAVVAELLGSVPKKELDNILKLVCNIFGVDNALIALFGERKIWVMNKISMDIQEGDFEWRRSFCAWTMASEQHQVMVVNDTLQDARFADNAMVVEGGIRFYAGSPLVSSRGHRLGTLCFADTKPRVFDTSSLQVLINFSELVSREMEREIVLAKQQYQQQQQQQQAAAAAAAVIPLDGVGGVPLQRQRLVERYQLLLRSIDCVASAVLLVDTAKPLWPILHASTGWTQLLQQLGGSNGGSSIGASLWQLGGSNGGSSGGCSSSSSIGVSLWSLLDAASMRSKAPGGRTAKQQVLQQVLSSQSFTLRGVRLAPHLGGATVQLVFRCAGFSTVQGAVSICLPSFAPDRSEVQAAAAALSRGSPTGTLVKPSTTPCDSLYFITVKVTQNTPSSGVTSSAAAGAVSRAGQNDVAITSVTGAGARVQGPGVELGFRGQMPPGFSLMSCAVTTGDSSSSVREISSNQLPYCFAGSFSGSNGSNAPGLGSVGSSSGGCGSSVLPVIDVVEHPQFSAADGAAERGDRGLVTDADVFLSDMVGVTAPPRPPSDAVSSSNLAVASAAAHSSSSNNSSAAGSSSSSSSSSSRSSNSLAVTLSSVSGFAASGLSQDYVMPAAAAALGSNGSSNSSSKPPPLPAAAAVGPGGQRSTGGWRLTVERSSSSGSNNNSIVGGGGPAASILAGLVCEKIAGLTLGGQIAAGSYGRVYKGTYFGSKVAVKVLDGADVLRRDASTGVSLEALLSSGLKHPGVVATLAWAVVAGKGQLPARVQVWGQTLDPSKPSIAQNHAAINTAAQPRPTQQQQQQQQPFSAQAASAGGSSTAAAPTAATAAAAAADALAAAGAVVGSDESSDEEDDSSESDLAAQVVEGQTWLIFEFCDKGCLQDACDRGWLRHKPSYISGPLNLAAVLATASEIASGMALLHSQGVVHGDLSAFNVMLSSNDPGAAAGNRGFVAKVADFGLARTLNHTSKVVTKTYGTLTHMPPEVLEHGLSSKAADVYSFGVLLWQMVTGSRAWAGMSHSAVVQAVCVKQQQLQFPSDAPEALSMLGQACMSYNPADRPTFEDILEVLEPCTALLSQ